MRSRLLIPLSAALLGLAGALGAAMVLYRAGADALEEVLVARLRAAGESAALLAGSHPPTAAELRALMEVNSLEGAYCVTPELAVSADATGPARRRVDLLRTDASQVALALAGEPRIARGYHLGELEVMAGFFPLRSEEGKVHSVLVLEAGRAFARARATLTQALVGGAALSLVGALALGLVAARWARDARERQEAAARAARGEALSKMAAMAAHEIRNPLGVIRGTVELMIERASATLSPRDRTGLEDVLGEVERLRRLTEDLLDLSVDRPLVLGALQPQVLLEEAARTTEAAFPGIRVRLALEGEPPELEGDAGRLRQVFANLLQNAAQAQGQGEVRLVAGVDGAQLVVRVEDDGPGVPGAIRARLLDPFVTGKESGTGLGLALCRRLVERHGGTLRLVPESRQGSTFEVRLPVRPA
ncbi:MAG TPA: HAMP domain-containing sensor histidine kinase [Hyalangium sp.]|nr:HAMP domain-containing sensor histidine kinase [Hyalangium sp.]